MMLQGVLPFQYEKDQNDVGITGLAGLPLYLDLAKIAHLQRVIERQLGHIGPSQGWTST